MLSNLAVSYSETPSPPHDSRLVFYSFQSADLLFGKQKEIEIICRAGCRAVALKWSVSRNLFREPFLRGTAESQPDNRFIIRIPTDQLKPGFFDLRVQLDAGLPKAIDGISTFGFRVSKMPITLDRPRDFEEFWHKGKVALAKVALDPKVGELKVYDAEAIGAYNVAHAALPPDYDPTGHQCERVEAAQVSFATLGGRRIHAQFAKPVGPGPFPAMLVLPGAGFNARPLPLEHARHGFVALDIQVHGQEVDLPEYPQLPGYNTDRVFSPPQDSYYFKVYLACVQAVNYLASLPEVDKSRIVVAGGSQGGRLSVVTAALDSRIAAAVPAITHNGNAPYLNWAEMSNAHVPPLNGMDRDAPPPLRDTPEGLCEGYYDVMSFAPDVKCPVMMNCGLVDPISPPSCVFAVYDLLGTKRKQIVPLTGLGHDWSAEFDRRAWRWLDQILKQKR